jgi:hypothetical protein
LVSGPTNYRNKAFVVVAAIGLTVFAAMAGYGLAEFARRPAAATSVAVQARPTWPPPCAKPEDREWCDLEAQWYAANAARESANFAFWQLLIGILGAAGLGGTLFFTIKATRAAARATLASEGALKHAQEMAYYELRAYVTFGIITVRREENRLYFQIPIVNTGQTPATSVVLRSYARLFAYPFAADEPPPLGESNEGQVFDLMPHAERGWSYFFLLGEEEAAAIEAQRQAFLMRLQISYTTYTGERVEGPVTDWMAADKEIRSGRFAVPSPECYLPTTLEW